ncbi:uncharacterized protein [Ptychodera flava]|uniref:uncharacterized protein n=1 Tax=Ptychodera flava TaxID=63121 RepID=UPI00396A205D
MSLKNAILIFGTGLLLLTGPSHGTGCYVCNTREHEDCANVFSLLLDHHCELQKDCLEVNPYYQNPVCTIATYRSAAYPDELYLERGCFEEGLCQNRCFTGLDMNNQTAEVCQSCCDGDFCNSGNFEGVNTMLMSGVMLGVLKFWIM